MKKTVDSKNQPDIKDYPSGYVPCDGGFWSYSRRAVRCGRNGWMFHKNVEKK